MNLRTIFSRAKFGLRRNLRTYLVSISSLTVAFLCLVIALLAITNLSDLHQLWSQQRLITVFLESEATQQKIDAFTLSSKNNPIVQSVQRVDPQQTRQFLTQNASSPKVFDSIPVNAFPDTIEIQLHAAASQQDIKRLGLHAQALGISEHVENYQSWLSPIARIAKIGKISAVALAILVLCCVLAVVANTIRLALMSRRQEIEISRVCGGTDAFVRIPLVVEGAFQGFVAAGASIVIAAIAFMAIREPANEAMLATVGIPIRFMDASMIACTVMTAALVGAAGSALSIRRYMEL